MLDERDTEAVNASGSANAAGDDALIPEFSSAADVCPVCKTDRFLNPKLRLMVSSCYHKMCVRSLPDGFAADSARFARLQVRVMYGQNILARSRTVSSLSYHYPKSALQTAKI